MAASVPVRQEQRLAAEELPFEFMMNALRLVEGFELRLFAERTGVPLHVLRKPLDVAERSGLIEQDHARVRPTLRGQRFLNDLLQIFLGDRVTA
jgi:oxygen-independent coproporphyrinogen-3 oxidase